ncbi:MAG: excinuclease ABC subunit C [Clostridia bacterium]|nr:excinuclease ABC subunit C [Clostridia bacterium]
MDIKETIKKEIVEKIPFDPGIYMMKDEDGKIIYVGKAKSLRKRVRQYFNKTNKTVRIQKMVEKIRNIEYIVTESELEALVLECNYIKEFMPKYNVMLKDDKTYPYVKITVKDKYPSIYITRTKVEDGSKYIGPFTDVNALRELFVTIREIFPLKRCKYNLNKMCNAKVGPCLYYHIGRCLGPCINDVAREEYNKMLTEIAMFLDGKTDIVKQHIISSIDKCIENLEFEKAQELKIRLEKIAKVTEKQKVSNLNETNTDIWGYVLVQDKLYIQIFKIRDSKLLKHDNILIDELEKNKIDETLIDILSQYYTVNKSNIPPRIYFKILNEEKQKEKITLTEEYLKTLRGLKVELTVPKKGSKLKLVEMIENNIEMNLKDKDKNPLEDLRNILGLEDTVDVVECYDISNLKDTFMVGAGITYEKDGFNKSKYRKYKIKWTETQNDVLCMSEVISRRLKHMDTLPLPDVFLIDGGLNQVHAVKQTLENNNVSVPVVGMIKDDKHRTRGIIDLNEQEIDLREDKNNRRLFKLITELQDEVHRFVITYHRSLRDKIK